MLAQELELVGRAMSIAKETGCFPLISANKPRKMADAFRP